MQQQQRNSTVSLIPGQDGDLQVVRVGGQILVDVQAAQRDVDGNLRHSHAIVRLSYANVLALRDLLDDIAEPTDYRQPAFPAIWSEASFTLPVPAKCRPGRRRLAA